MDFQLHSMQFCSFFDHFIAFCWPQHHQRKRGIGFCGMHVKMQFVRLDFVILLVNEVNLQNEDIYERVTVMNYTETGFH